MLEKIGLPPKPSLRGNNWVVDGSHCQGCSSQFTFINRKHHCRRCGGLFCNSCTQQRMVLRGQGDSPVRICEPCKKLEEASRFEMRYGHKSRSGRGGKKLTGKSEDEVLNEILSNEGKPSISSGSVSSIDILSSDQLPTSSASCSNIQEIPFQDDRGGIQRSLSNDQPTDVSAAMVNATPEDLRQQAVEEKKKYRTLKAEGKPEEALRAFKRGKELERQAGALEINLRKSRRKALSFSDISEPPSIKSDAKASSLENKHPPQKNKEKDDLAAELRGLGWSDMDFHDADKKPVTMSLEGELSNLLGEDSQRANTEKGTHGIDKSQVTAHKRKALELKRQGKLAEAKEELKRAKVLEKQIEEQELLGEDEDSDEEFSSLLRSVNFDKHNDTSFDYNLDHGFDVDHVGGLGDDLGLDGDLDVTQEDMYDPDMIATLQSLGWTEETAHAEDLESQFATTDTEALVNEIQSLKKAALNQKRAGNSKEALALFRKAKLLEKELDSANSGETNLMADNSVLFHDNVVSETVEKPMNQRDADVRNVNERKDMSHKISSKSKSLIQRELLGLKKRALALRREGKLDEAEEELKKGEVLEKQLEELENAPKVTHSIKQTGESMIPDAGDEVTDQDMNDPSYLKLLKTLGWSDELNENLPPSSSEKNVPVCQSEKNDPRNVNERKDMSHKISSKNKSLIQRELLGLKKRALALRREGKLDEAEEELKKGEVLEKQLEELENAPKVTHSIKQTGESMIPDGGDEVTDQDMNDPSYLKLLKPLGWSDDLNGNLPPSSSEKNVPAAAHIDAGSTFQAKIDLQAGGTRKGKSEIQRELLGLKRKSLALRRQGEVEEAEEVLKMAKVLEAQLAEIETLTLKEVPTESNEHKEYNVPHQSLEIDSQSGQLNAIQSPLIDLHSTGLVTAEKPKEMVHSYEKQSISELTSAQEIASQNDGHLLQQDILAHKRKALSLKREGKVMEAKEELRQAKLLEKLLEENKAQPSTRSNELSGSDVSSKILEQRIEEDKPEPNSSSNELSGSDVSSKILEKRLEENKPQPNTSSNELSGSDVSSVGKKDSSPSSGPKPLSSRDRFKLQQKALNHKRQALKLRREGRTEEADAEFELAKALEAQLEESATLDSTTSVKASEPVDEVMVEDFLDPQLFAALKAIGLDEVSSVSQGPEKRESKKQDASEIDNSNEERMQLEEQIKAEKVKALNFKRSGKRAEALDALRMAKLLEKKLNSLTAK